MWGGGSPPSLSSLCAVQTVIDTQMAEVTALLCKWSLDQIQSRLHGGGWVFAIKRRVGGGGFAMLASRRLIQSWLIGMAVDS